VLVIACDLFDKVDDATPESNFPHRDLASRSIIIRRISEFGFPRGRGKCFPYIGLRNPELPRNQGWFDASLERGMNGIHLTLRQRNYIILGGGLTRVCRRTPRRVRLRRIVWELICFPRLWHQA
jgi:hypothetical protein